ncbi:MAG TPA: pirin family protein, partial [Candidatus Udaeobacter sp.]|nr:pirin family protein [Candidatus Udaeobacter sp.]
MDVTEVSRSPGGATKRGRSARPSAAKTTTRARPHITREVEWRTSAESAIQAVKPLASPWKTLDPFIFCVHHEDHFPAGNKQMGPAASLDDRNIGNDFSGKDGWSMYHGDVVPGFPAHPHIGFEIVTVLRQGTIDHFDSLNATARYGSGDVQWITAGQGMQHSEMFPLLDRHRPNPLELFQIWVNLPHANKRELPNFKLLWRHQIPHRISRDEAGRTTEITVVAGELDDAKAPTPPPKSWASRADTHVAIWIIKMAPNATWTLPRTKAGLNRALYFYRGGSLKIEDVPVQSGHLIELEPGCDVHLRNTGEAAQL